MEHDQTLVLIDGHALIHRAFHAIQNPLTVSTTGQDVRAVYGFTNAFLKCLEEMNPSHIVVTFDLPKPTFRHKLFKEYKAHRKPSPPELRGQFDIVRNLMKEFKVPIFELEGYEADDLLGTLSDQAEKTGIKSLILTGDSDTLQLVTPNVQVIMNSGTQKQTTYDIDGVKGRYGGLGPEYVAQIKALQGDSSDNIPGVPGIGIKTAINLLLQFGSIDEIFNNIELVKPPKAQSNLKEFKQLAYSSYELTQIIKSVPVTLDLSQAEFGNFDRDNVVNFLANLEFHSIIPRIPNLFDSNSNQPNQNFDEILNYKIIENESELDLLIPNLIHGFSFDTETTSTDAMETNIVGISLSTSKNSGWYIPVGHNKGNQIPQNIIVEKLSPAFSNIQIPKRAHNAIFDITVLENIGVKVNGLEFDTMIAAHVLGKRNLGLKDLVLENFGFEMTKIETLIGSGRNQITMAEVEIKEASQYAISDADFTQQLYEKLNQEILDANISQLTSNLEFPLIRILNQMQLNGVSIDTELLNSMSEVLGNQLDQIQSEMYELIGHEFNLNSPKQLSELLFNELNLPPTRKIKSGFSTDAQSLDDLKTTLDFGNALQADPRSYEVLSRILEFREISKIKSTYVDALPSLVNHNTHRIHTNYRQAGTSTGRISSNDPNVQNIPVRTELGRKVREAFIPQNPLSILLAADYSQIELRVLAHFSNDTGLLQAFKNGEDIHNATAALVYNVHTSDVTKDMRRIAKILNFGVIYGLSAHGISRQTDLNQKEGKEFIDIYFEKYPGILNYLEDIKAKCRETGYVETILGRRRYFPDVNSSNFRVRSQAERAAINMPIQGTAADIIKVAMIQIQKKIEETHLNSKMILQVHDELIFEVPNNEIEVMESILEEIMPYSISLNVPLGIEMKKGNSWGTLS
ncbi:MAG: DNA polymerase I [Dehalococcoidia bacterium]|mgnify:CR=1 FL=1